MAPMPKCLFKYSLAVGQLLLCSLHSSTRLIYLIIINAFLNVIIYLRKAIRAMEVEAPDPVSACLLLEYLTTFGEAIERGNSAYYVRIPHAASGQDILTLQVSSYS